MKQVLRKAGHSSQTWDKGFVGVCSTICISALNQSHLQQFASTAASLSSTLPTKVAQSTSIAFQGMKAHLLTALEAVAAFLQTLLGVEATV